MRIKLETFSRRANKIPYEKDTNRSEKKNLRTANNFPKNLHRRTKCRLNFRVKFARTAWPAIRSRRNRHKERRNGRSKYFGYLERRHVLSMIERSSRRNEQSGRFVDRIFSRFASHKSSRKKFAETNDVEREKGARARNNNLTIWNRY